MWPGMRRDVQAFVGRCPTCRTHRNREVRVGYSEMPLPVAPMQVVGMDIVGPFVRSRGGNKYLLNIIDHCTGWAESYPLSSKDCRMGKTTVRTGLLSTPWSARSYYHGSWRRIC